MAGGRVHILHIPTDALWHALAYVPPLEVLDAPRRVCGAWREGIDQWLADPAHLALFLRRGVDMTRARAYHGGDGNDASGATCIKRYLAGTLVGIAARVGRAVSLSKAPRRERESAAAKRGDAHAERDDFRPASASRTSSRGGGGGSNGDDGGSALRWCRIAGQQEQRSSVESIFMSTPAERAVYSAEVDDPADADAVYLFAGSRDGCITCGHRVDTSTNTTSVGGDADALTQFVKLVHLSSVWSTLYWRERDLVISGTGGVCVDVHFLGGGREDDVRRHTSTPGGPALPPTQSLYFDDSVFTTQMVDWQRGVLAAGGWEGGLTLYKFDKSAWEAAVPGKAADVFKQTARVDGLHSDALWRSGVVCPTSGTLATAGWDGKVNLLDIASLTATHTWATDTGASVVDFRVSDDNFFWALDQMHVVRFYDARCAHAVQEMDLSTMSLHPNRLNAAPGMLLVASSTVHIYDQRYLTPATGRELQVFGDDDCRGGAVLALEFPSPCVRPVAYQHDWLALGRFSGDVTLCRAAGV